jgi:alanine dehydrogenase
LNVPRTSTFALTNSTLPYALALANRGGISAVKENKALFKGVNTFNGCLTIAEVAKDQVRSYTSLTECL